MEEIHSSYTPAIVVHLLSCTFDVKMWMDEVAEKDLSGHVEQHQFKVSRNVIGQTESVFLRAKFTINSFVSLRVTACVSECVN